VKSALQRSQSGKDYSQPNGTVKKSSFFWLFSAETYRKKFLESCQRFEEFIQTQSSEEIESKSAKFAAELLITSRQEEEATAEVIQESQSNLNRLLDIQRQLERAIDSLSTSVDRSFTVRPSIQLFLVLLPF